MAAVSESDAVKERNGVSYDHEPTTFSFKNTKRLIQLVQARPCLWDYLLPEYKDRLARDHAWAEIFTELEPAYKSANSTLKHEISVSITKKWHNIRDSYVKSMKPGYLGRRNRPYIHADMLKFLDVRYFDKMRKSRRNEIHNESLEETENEPWEHEVFVGINEVDEGNPNKRVKMEYQDDEIKEDSSKIKEDDDIVAILANLIEKEEDEDRAFFKSITPSVKMLSENSKFIFRIEVMKLIKSLRMKDRKRMSLKAERIPDNESESE